MELIRSGGGELDGCERDKPAKFLGTGEGGCCVRVCIVYCIDSELIESICEDFAGVLGAEILYYCNRSRDGGSQRDDELTVKRGKAHEKLCSDPAYLYLLGFPMCVYA